MGRTLFLLIRCSKFPLYYRKVSVVLMCAAVLMCTSLVHASGTLQLHSDTTHATAGYYQLTWSWSGAQDDVIYSLREYFPAAKNHEGREIYHGPDLASVISGKTNGTYRYIVHALSASGERLAQSNAIQVNVTHHSLMRAWLVFALGAVVFITILAVIKRESAKLNRGEE